MTFHESFRRINARRFLLQFRKPRPLALILIVLCLIVNGPLRQWRIRGNLEISWKDFCKSPGTSPGWILVEETQAAFAAAGGVSCSVLSPKKRRAWDAHNPCAGREHLLRLWTKQKRSLPDPDITQQQGGEASALLQVLFSEYANLHRSCTHGGDMDYVTQLFESGDESSTPCKFSIVEFGTQGLGNRLLWMISAFQHALLTKRVLLIDTRSNVDEILCEPFPGSSWALPSNFSYSPLKEWPEPFMFQRLWDDWENRGLEVKNENENVNAEKPHNYGLETLDHEDTGSREKRIRKDIRSWMSEGDRLSEVDDEETTSQNSERRSLMTGNIPPPMQHRPPYFHHVRASEGWAPHARFFCDNEHERLQNVKWINFIKGCLYFVPDLFAIPSFRPILEDLFPNRDPVTHLLRQLALPVDSIWERVRDVYTKEFSRARNVIGVQVRYRNGVSMYTKYNSRVNERISQCGLQHGLLPDPAAASGVNHHPKGPLVIFVASLFPGLRDHLATGYQDTIERSRMKLVQLSEVRFQFSDLGSDQQAFLEMICLSLVDDLLTSPLSTYGQIGQGLGGLTPWLIDFERLVPGENSTNCVRGQSTDACFQDPPISEFTCPFNKDVDGKKVTEVVPYLKHCQDLADGFQLVPPWSPSIALPNQSLPIQFSRSRIS